MNRLRWRNADFARAFRYAVLAAAIVTTRGSLCRADVFLLGDEPYPEGGEIFTADPELFGVNARGLTTGRELRQTFQNPTTFDVKKIVLSLAQIGATNGGLIANFYEVPDVNAGNIGDPPPGTLVHTFSIASSLLPTTTLRLGISLTGDDVFSLPQRNTGTEGYAIELRQIDTAVQTGTFRHSNDGTDHYTAGRLYTETGANSRADRDFGVSLSSTEVTLLLGDTDGDGVVEPEDLMPIRQNYLQTVTLRADGDLTGDHMVTFADFRQWKTAILAGGGSLTGLDLSFVSVPEPSALVLALWGLVGIWCCRAARRGASHQRCER